MKKILLTLAAVAAFTVSAQEFTPDTKLRMANHVIENYYVEDVNSDTIVTEAIKAMLKTLDPHSAYTTPRKLRNSHSLSKGNSVASASSSTCSRIQSM